MGFLSVICWGRAADLCRDCWGWCRHLEEATKSWNHSDWGPGFTDLGIKTLSPGLGSTWCHVAWESGHVKGGMEWWMGMGRERLYCEGVKRGEYWVAGMKEKQWENEKIFKKMKRNPLFLFVLRKFSCVLSILMAAILFTLIFLARVIAEASLDSLPFVWGECLSYPSHPVHFSASLWRTLVIVCCTLWSLLHLSGYTNHLYKPLLVAFHVLGPCAGHSRFRLSFQAARGPGREDMLLTPFCRWRNWDTERLS